MISSDGAGRRAIGRSLEVTFGIKPESISIPMSGKTDPQILLEILAQEGMPECEAARHIEKIIEIYLKFLEEEIANCLNYIMHDGVRDLIAALNEESNAHLGLLTGNVERGARMKLARFDLNHHFPIGAFGSDAVNRLDLPAIAKARGDRHYRREFAPSEMVIIGDSVNDVRCAKHFGARSIVAHTGKTTREELMGENPDYLFPSLANTDLVLSAILA